jgi:1-deoxy-D-xylulose-5-phosphate synthase
MLGPTGLDKFAERFPDRTFDVGIAEQHATTSAAGMAFAGLHPVVAVYSTFLNRAFDQLLMDVALHKAPVTFVLDRAGVTGDDGASHNGVWDLALTGIVPGLRVAAPRDAESLEELLTESVNIESGPTLIRFPKGAVGENLPACEKYEGIDLLYRGDSEDILLISVGAFARVAIEAAARAHHEGVGVTVVDPRWVNPLPDQLISMAEKFRSVIVLEDGICHGGIGSTFSEMVRAKNLDMKIKSMGVPLEFLDHAKRDEILFDLNLTIQSLAREMIMQATPLADISESNYRESDPKPSYLR